MFPQSSVIVRLIEVGLGKRVPRSEVPGSKPTKVSLNFAKNKGPTRYLNEIKINFLQQSPHGKQTMRTHY